MNFPRTPELLEFRADMDDQLLEDALRALISWDSRQPIQLERAKHGEWDMRPDLTGGEVDQVLRDLLHQGYIEARVQEIADDLVYWWEVNVTVNGLRHLGEWPLEGREHLSGPCDEGIWGTVDRPTLSALEDNPQGFVIRPLWAPSEEWRQWEGDNCLRAAGLVEGRHKKTGSPTSDSQGQAATFSTRQMMTPSIGRRLTCVRALRSRLSGQRLMRR